MVRFDNLPFYSYSGQLSSNLHLVQLLIVYVTNAPYWIRL